MKQRFYIDIYVIGGIYDAEFEIEPTLLFEKAKLRQIVCVYSNLTKAS